MWCYYVTLPFIDERYIPVTLAIAVPNGLWGHLLADNRCDKTRED